MVFTTNKKHLLKHLQKDPVLFAYHLGDLDDFYFPHCQWAADYHERARIEEVVLIYTGLPTPSVLAFGTSDRFTGLLDELMDLLPDKFFCHYQDENRDKLLTQFSENSLGNFLKMQLVDKTKIGKVALSDKIKKLDESHLSSLAHLFERAYPETYFHEKMLKTGLYFGYFGNDEILSVAGVHVDSKEYGVTALGNIATHPDHRGRGLAKMVTARLLNEIVDKRDVITLNVKAGNKAAIKCYSDLGFVKTHDYCEGLFTRN